MTTECPLVNPFGHYSKTQTATILSVDRKTIYRYCRDGKLYLHYNKITSKNYILGKDILKLWEGK